MVWYMDGIEPMGCIVSGGCIMIWLLYKGAWDSSIGLYMDSVLGSCPGRVSPGAVYLMNSLVSQSSLYPYDSMRLMLSCIC